MSNTDPRYQQTTEGTDRGTGTQQMAVPNDSRNDFGGDRTEFGDNRTDYGDNPTDYGDNRTGFGENRTDYRQTTMPRPEPAGYQGVGTYGNDAMEVEDIPTRKVRETKPAFLTTEFWFAAGGIAALIVIYLITDDATLDLFRTALLATLIGISYIVSRGLAKAGTRTTWQPQDPRFTVGRDLR
jgi:hypothetical protein